ncbi:hypothetical protein SUGI_0101190 [Cryptomeria japonica]|nr:hypothetical protein SUGI_0101190 [Cryptomeria japonica]
MGRLSPCLCFMMLLILLIFLAKAPATQSWGSEGHYITCKIAQPLLSEAAANAVQKLLPSSAEGDLASVCSWADTVRSIYPWSSSLHFANPPNVCNYDYTRDCHNTQGEKDMCVAGAINNYTSQLASYGDLSTAVPCRGDGQMRCPHGTAAPRTLCLVFYASESISLACEWAYKDVTADAILGDDYFLSRLPIVEKRLAQGGVRLAATLNRIFSSGIDFSK